MMENATAGPSTRTPIRSKRTRDDSENHTSPTSVNSRALLDQSLSSAPHQVTLDSAPSSVDDARTHVLDPDVPHISSGGPDTDALHKLLEIADPFSPADAVSPAGMSRPSPLQPTHKSPMLSIDLRPPATPTQLPPLVDTTSPVHSSLPLASGFVGEEYFTPSLAETAHGLGMPTPLSLSPRRPSFTHGSSLQWQDHELPQALCETSSELSSLTPVKPHTSHANSNTPLPTSKKRKAGDESSTPSGSRKKVKTIVEKAPLDAADEGESEIDGNDLADPPEALRSREADKKKRNSDDGKARREAENARIRALRLFFGVDRGLSKVKALDEVIKGVTATRKAIDDLRAQEQQSSWTLSKALSEAQHWRALFVETSTVLAEHGIPLPASLGNMIREW